ncbi:hypothetical protein HYT95_02820 [Candidatus Peregrinibacteria bacterium]|nr:hypothetical protein [Candidatus Peregrinibacteria bacterium]
MRKVRLAIWDWNGTLQNDATHIYDGCVRRIFRHFALPCPSFEVYRREIAHDYMEFYQRHGVPSHVTNDELNGIFRSGVEGRSHQPNLFPDARHALKKTAEILEKQHLVSGCPEDTSHALSEMRATRQRSSENSWKNTGYVERKRW